MVLKRCKQDYLHAASGGACTPFAERMASFDAANNLLIGLTPACSNGGAGFTWSLSVFFVAKNACDFDSLWVSNKLSFSQFTRKSVILSADTRVGNYEADFRNSELECSENINVYATVPTARMNFFNFNKEYIILARRVRELWPLDHWHVQSEMQI